MVGRIIRPHGVRGEVSVEVRTDTPDQRFAVGSVLGTEPTAAGPLTVASARWHTGRLLVRFAEAEDRSQAEGLRGIWLTVDAADIPPPDDEHGFHDRHLIGLAVVTVGGEPVGTVTDVLHHGQDLLVIEPAAPPGDQEPAPDAAAPAGEPTGRAVGPAAAGKPAAPAGGRGEVLVPFVSAIVVAVDLAAGRLVISPPPGLLDLAQGGPGRPERMARRAD